MGAESLLFPEMQAGPPGFRYCEDFVTEEEEKTLAASLGQLDLKPFEFHGYLGNRRVASFGLKYDYERRSVEPASAMPEFLDDLLARVAEFAGCEPEAFRQVGVNEYRPGAAIGWHKDKPQFGIVVGVSLLAPATMRLRRAEGKRWARITHIVQPRSVYILFGEARAQWEHSIPPGERPAVLDHLSDAGGMISPLHGSNPANLEESRLNKCFGLNGTVYSQSGCIAGP